MLTYEYECQGCGRTFEVQQRISAPPLESCNQCGGAVRRLLNPAPFILKGKGWYVSDYPSDARRKALKAESSQTATPSTEAKSSTAPPATSPSSNGSGSASPSKDPAKGPPAS